MPFPRLIHSNSGWAVLAALTAFSISSVLQAQVPIIQPGAPAAVGQPVYAQPAVVVANAQPQQVAVVCPEGCVAGSMLEVNINGKPMSVAVPQGVVPGQQFLVSAP